MPSFGVKLGVGVVAGHLAGTAAGKLIGKLARAAGARREAELRDMNKAVAPETLNGKPVGALAAEVLRELKADAYRKEHGPPPKRYTPEDVARVFDPMPTPYANALRQLGPELRQSVAAIAAAPDLTTALNLARGLPELFQVSETGTATIFELRLKRSDPDDTPEGWRRTYATSIRLVASKHLMHGTLRLQAVQHDAVREHHILARAEDLVAFDHAVGTDALTRLTSSKPVTTELVERELRNSLDPAALAKAVEQLLVSGRPTRVEQPY